MQRAMLGGLRGRVRRRPRVYRVLSTAEKEVVHPDGLPRWANFTTSSGWLRFFDYVGTVSFAASGTLAAGAVGMDALGCTAVGTITAVGGGTVRDVLIGNAPVFWMVEAEYLLLCVGTATATFFGLGPWGLDIDSQLLDFTDTIGIGAFCVIGAQNGIRKGLPAVVCALCGLMTSTFGGLTRDVLCNKPVRILHSHAELYATCAFMGAGAYVLARRLGAPTALRIAAGMSTGMGMRFASQEFGLRLPKLPDEEPEAAESTA